MSKLNRRIRRHEKIYKIQNKHRRQELEWSYGELNERHLETLRNGLIFAWLFLCFVFAFFLKNEQAIVVWAGIVAMLLVIVYQARSLWLSRKTEKRIAEELGESCRD